MMCEKIGIVNPVEEDKFIINNLLTLIESYKTDYTNTFAALTLDEHYKDPLFESNDFSIWRKHWKERIKDDKNSYKVMENNNPIYIPRNNLVELALKNAINGDKQEFDNLLNLLSQAYNYNAEYYDFQKIPKNFDESYKTYCGT